MTDDAMRDRTPRTRATDRPLENPAESQAEIRGRRADLDDELGPATERTDPSNPPNDNAPLGESGGAGMENPATEHPDPSRERFRDLRS